MSSLAALSSRRKHTTSIKKPLRLAVESLEDRLVPAVNLLVTTGTTTGQQLFKEYTSSGTQVRSVTVPTAPAGPSDTARDVVADASGKIFVYNGANPAALAKYSSNSWSQQTYSGWDTYNMPGFGGLAQFQNYVFATDMSLNNTPNGIVRFDTSSGAATRFANGFDFIDLNVGLDGKVYALSGPQVVVYDPVSLAYVRSFQLQANNDYRGIAVAANGDVYAASWNNRVTRFTSNGVQTSYLTLTGPGDGTAFGNPMDIDVSPEGKLAVGTRTGHVVQMTISLTGVTYFRTWTGTQPQVPAFVSFATWQFPPPPPPLPTLSLSDVTVVEGTGMGGPVVKFYLTLSAPSSQSVQVDYATANGTALGNDLDYHTWGGTIGFWPGATTQVIAIPIASDALYENEEYFYVNLSNPLYATIADGQGVCTITNDDAMPTVSVNDVTVTTPTSGTTNAAFRVSLSAVSGLPVTVNYMTSNGSATSPQDYWATGGTITIPAGLPWQTSYVVVNGDPYWSPNETFNFNLSNASGATIGDGQGIGTITSSLPMPTISVSDEIVQNATSGITPVTFIVSLSAPVSDPFAVYYTTADGTANAGSDYAAASGYVDFAPGDTYRGVTVNVYGDSVYDGDETFKLNLMPLAGGDPYASGTATILSSLPAPALAVGNASVQNVESGATPMTFTVTLAASSADPVTVDYATVDGTAIGGVDYQAASGTLTFAAGETTKTITVNVVGNANYALTKSFTIGLSNPAGATLGDDSGAGTMYCRMYVDEGEVIPFDASGLPGDPLTFTWDFGDGTSAAGWSANHAYADNGVYSVTVSVEGVVASTATITAFNKAPDAGVSGPSTAAPGQPRAFTFTAVDPSSVDQAAGFTYLVDWGDGSSDTVQGPGTLQLTHVFAFTGSYDVDVIATDKDGYSDYTVAALPVAVATAGVQSGDLIIGGTSGPDVIRVRIGAANGDVEVVIDDVSLGTFAVTGQIVIYGNAGDDSIAVFPPYMSGYPEMTLPVVLYGGDGDDLLSAISTSGAAVLLGGAGDDTLYGGDGRNIEIGGTGWDIVYGHYDDDVLIGGTTDFDDNLEALIALRTEWARTDADYQTRIDHLTGAQSGGLNGSAFLNASTVHGDGERNYLWGGPGLDWFLALGGSDPDLIFDLGQDEVATWL